MNRDPRWLDALVRRFRWVGIPNLSIILITMQVMGFLFIYLDPAWYGRLVLDPDAVFGGQVWRLVTFLAVPVSMSPLWLLFALWFLYFILNLVEADWGETKTTLYVLVSIVLTLAYSLVTGYTVAQATDLVSTLFLAAATLFPNMEILLFFVVPVKLRWLGIAAVVFLVLRFANSGWAERGYLAVMYSNYLLFFGPALLYSLQQWHRRRDFQRKMRR